MGINYAVYGVPKGLNDVMLWASWSDETKPSHHSREQSHIIMQRYYSADPGPSPVEGTAPGDEKVLSDPPSRDTVEDESEESDSASIVGPMPVMGTADSSTQAKTSGDDSDEQIPLAKGQGERRGGEFGSRSDDE